MKSELNYNKKLRRGFLSAAPLSSDSFKDSCNKKKENQIDKNIGTRNTIKELKSLKFLSST